VGAVTAGGQVILHVLEGYEAVGHARGALLGRQRGCHSLRIRNAGSTMRGRAVRTLEMITLLLAPWLHARTVSNTANEANVFGQRVLYIVSGSAASPL
jgi:hypothetical protein